MLCDEAYRGTDQTGVLLAPGIVFDMEGYLRLGYANDTDVLVAGLAQLGDFLADIAAA